MLENPTPPYKSNPFLGTFRIFNCLWFSVLLSSLLTSHPPARGRINSESITAAARDWHLPPPTPLMDCGDFAFRVYIACVNTGGSQIHPSLRGNKDPTLPKGRALAYSGPVQLIGQALANHRRGYRNGAILLATTRAQGLTHRRSPRQPWMPPAVSRPVRRSLPRSCHGRLKPRRTDGTDLAEQQVLLSWKGAHGCPAALTTPPPPPWFEEAAAQAPPPSVRPLFAVEWRAEARATPAAHFLPGGRRLPEGGVRFCSLEAPEWGPPYPKAGGGGNGGGDIVGLRQVQREGRRHLPATSPEGACFLTSPCRPRTPLSVVRNGSLAQLLAYMVYIVAKHHWQFLLFVLAQWRLALRAMLLHFGTV